MIRYLIRRILYAVPILLGVMLLTFALFFLVSTPDSLARRNLSSKNPTPTQIHEWLSEHGYDKPAGEQFVGYMENLSELQVRQIRSHEGADLRSAQSGNASLFSGRLHGNAHCADRFAYLGDGFGLFSRHLCGPLFDSLVRGFF